MSSTGLEQRLPELIGRDAELRMMTEFLHRVRGTGDVMAVCGALGVGKSGLLEATVESARGAGFTAVCLRGHRAEAELSGTGLTQLLLELRTLTAPAPTEDAADFDWLEQLPAKGHCPPGNLMQALTQAVSSVGPLLLVLDDVQWFDACSLDTLVTACRDHLSPGVGLLFAGRSLPHGLVSHDAVLALEPLDADASKRILLQHADPLGPLLATRALREAEGNPAGLIAMSKALSNSQVTMDVLLAPRLPLGEDLQNKVIHLLEGLPEKVSRYLLLVAIATTDRADSLSRAATALGLEVDDLREAEARGLLSCRYGSIRFCQPLLRSAVYWAAYSAHRRQVHSALARSSDGDPYQRAFHSALASAVPDEATAAALEAGVTEALPEAAAILHLAADLSPNEKDASRRLIKAAQAAEIRDQTSYLRHLVGRFHSLPVVDTSTSAAARALEAHLAYKSDGIPAHAMDMLIRAEESVSEWPPPSLPLAVALAPVLCELPATDPIHRRADGLISEDPARVQNPAFMAVLSWLNRDKYAFEARRLLDAADRSLDQGNFPGSPSQDSALIVIATALDDPVTANRLGEPLLSALIRLGHFATARVVLAHLQIARLHLGDPQAVAEGSSLGERWTRSVDDPRSTVVFRVGVAQVRAWEGSEEGHQALTDDILAFALPRRLHMVTARARWARGLMALSLGRPEESYEELRGLFAPDGDARHPVVSGWALGDFAQAAVAAGRADEAREYVQRASSASHQLGSALLEHVGARSLGMLADDQDREGFFARALAVPGSEAFRFEWARTQLAYGEWLRRRRRVLEARDHLQRARMSFESVQAHVWTRRANSELLAAGEVSASPQAFWSTEFGLTPREAEVAQLAAAGLSNQSISWQLGMTQRTVGSHLSRVFAKVGVSSRKQLPSVGQEPPR
ncbi:AAA family ATPase [Streptomyces sp. NPDC002755]